MRHWLHFCLLFIYITTLFANPALLYAMPQMQGEMATLQIENVSSEPIAICDIFLVRTPTEVVLDIQEQINLPSGAHKQFSVPPGYYRLLVSDCEQNTLSQQQNLLISGHYRLPLIAQTESNVPSSPSTESNSNSTICGIASSQGTNAIQEGDFKKALANFQIALTCYRDMNERTGEAATLLGLGMAASGQGLANEAINYYEQALVVIREVGLHHTESTVLNSIGNLFFIQGRYTDALPRFEQALTTSRREGDHNAEGTALNSIGMLYRAQGRFNDALTSFKYALKSMQEGNNQLGKGIILKNIGETYSVQGRFTEALEILGQALAILQKSDNPTGQGQTLNIIGEVYINQGKYNEALVACESALAIAQKVGDRIGEGAALNNIGMIHYAQGRNDQALVKLEEALTIRQEIADLAGQETTLANIGVVYHAQGRTIDAIDKMKQALAIARVVGRRADEGTILNHIGVLYSEQGHYGDAIANHEQALVIQREGDNHFEIARILANIGSVYYAQGRKAEALDKLEQALALIREVDSPIYKSTISNNIGVLYADQGRYDEALENYEYAHAIYHELGDLEGEGQTIANIGSVYYAQRRYDEALESYEQALTIYRRSGNRISEGTILNNIGFVYNAQRRYGEAQTNYEDALKVARDMGNDHDEGDFLNNIGFMYYDQGRNNEALQAFLGGIEKLEMVRRNAGDDQARTSLANDLAVIYGRIIELYHLQGEVLQAFLYSEAGRARTLLDALSTGQVLLSDNESTELLIQEQEAYKVRQSAEDALAKARAAIPPDPTWVAEAEKTLKEEEAVYQKASNAIVVRSDQLASLIPGRQKVPQLAEVQALLDADTTLLSYWTLEDKTLAFVITAKDASIVELPGVTAQSVLTLTQNLHQWSNLDNSHPLPLRQLYAALIAPLADKLKTPHLAIIPHQTLHYVPFAALIDDAHDKQYLGEKYTLTLLPSASVLPFLQQNAAAAQANPTGCAVVFGDPASSESGLPRLENAAAEASAVAALLDTTVLTDTAATEALLYQMATDARIIHLAAHGQYNGANALYSAIYLARSSPLTATDVLPPTAGLPTVDSTLDGRLETWEIFGLPLKGNDLVVLSACETTVNDLAKENRVALSRGDELVSLTRAFIFAGAPTVIASLWSVDDAATEALMVSFYQHWLQDGMSKAEALQAAQADVRADPRWASPFYWAGFVLNGDGGAAAPASSSGTR